MGARGPLKLPAQLRVVADGDVAGTLAETVKREAPLKPSDLTPAERTVWDQIVTSLDEIGLLARVDALTVRLAIRHYLAAMRASDQLLGAESIVLHDDKNGRDMKHPASQVFRDHSSSFLAYAQQLGMTFVSRARLEATGREAGAGGGGNPFVSSGTGS